MKTKTTHIIYINIAFILLISLTARAQQSLNDLADQLESRVATCATELIYLQTSKGIYETGEDLWFKTYQLNSQTFGLSEECKTLYLQMIGSEDSIVWQEKYPIDYGIGTGHIYIDENLPEGDYYLHGYTSGSFYQNDLSSIIASRKIRIVRNISDTQITGNPKDTDFRFETYPEGGTLVYGILSTLAFKATDGKGNPIEVVGTLYQDDEPISALKSRHDGMGAILFTPLAGKSYRIDLTTGKSYAITDILDQGISLRLAKQNEKQLDFAVSQSEGLPPQTVYLVGQMRGMVFCTASAVLKEELLMPVPTDLFLYQGIAEFTLYNEDMHPVAERLVYLHPDKKMQIETELDQERYGIRDKVTMKIKAKDENGNPIRSNLGVSVFDGSYENPADPVNILSYCYLSSQIRGKIHNPCYYFDQENNDRLRGLDLLLLTQGWRKYVWDNDNLNSTAGKRFLEDGLSGKQTIGSKRKKKEMSPTEQVIKVSGAELNSTLAWVDSTGYFSLDTEVMKELRGGYVYLKPMLGDEFNPKLEITPDFSLIDDERKTRQFIYPVIELDQVERRLEKDRLVISGDSTVMLDQVIVKAKGQKPFRDKFMGKLDSLYRMDLRLEWVCECPNHPNPFLNDYMNGYSHHPNGMNANPHSGKRLLPERGKLYQLIKYEPGKDDGVWHVTDINYVFYDGPQYTEEELLKRNNIYRTKGYYAHREFYHPDETDMQLSIPDARNTLFWDPNVITDENGEATISFYCSDINTEFIGIIEGVDGMGLLGTAKFEFRVYRK